MMQSTVLLLRSAHPGWNDLRTALRARADLGVTAAALRGAEVLAAAAVRHPTFVLLAAEVADRPLVPLVGDVRIASPTSKLLVLGTRATLDRDTLVALWHRGVVGYYVWDGLCAAAVLQGLDAVRDADVLVGSRAVLETLLSVERRQHPRIEGLLLSPQERGSIEAVSAGFSSPLPARDYDVLHLVAQRYHDKEIAAALTISEGTVKVHVRRLKDRFNVETREALITIGQRLGDRV